MNLAARNRDTELAQDVFDFLSRRDTVFEAQHYEMILEAYVNANMPAKGFYVLSAMQQAGVIPNDGTTRRLFSWLKRQQAETVKEMFAELQDIKEKGGPIPVAAVNVLIEAAVWLRDLDLAVDLYKAIPETCVSTANLATFNILFKLCRQQRRKGLALSLAGEMVSLRIPPDAMTYDRMMLVCFNEEDYEDGVRYYKEMRAKGFEPRFGSALVVVRTLTKWADDRVDEILDDLEGMNLPLRMPELRRWVKLNFGKVESPVRLTTSSNSFKTGS
jgi:pentatricopeptide repeat protein